MQIIPDAVDRLSTIRRGSERRGKPRICEPFPATVHGVNAQGESFELSAVLDNLSAGGLYLRLAHCITEGTNLFITIRLSFAATDDVSAPRVATHGVVLRAEPMLSGACGVALRFSDHQFL
jgi:hypothetical protein